MPRILPGEECLHRRERNKSRSSCSSMRCQLTSGCRREQQRTACDALFSQSIAAPPRVWIEINPRNLETILLQRGVNARAWLACRSRRGARCAQSLVAGLSLATIARGRGVSWLTRQWQTGKLGRGAGRVGWTVQFTAATRSTVSLGRTGPTDRLLR